LFKENLDWYQLNKYLVGEERNKNFLFTTRPTENNIKFYYENPNFISMSKFILKYTRPEANLIKIDIPLQENKNITQKISVYCEKHGAVDDPSKYRKRIISGGSEFKVELEKSEKIILAFNGRRPSSLSSPILRISLCNEGRTYLVPIDFVKRLPDWASKLFIVLQTLFWVGSILLVVGLLVFFALKKVVKEQQTETGEKPSPPGNSFEKEESHGPKVDISPSSSIKDESPAEEKSLININTAQANELKALTGINAKRARQIKTMRENHPFKTIDELKGVLGKDIYRKIKDKICV